MKDELELQLVAKYPRIFRDYGGDIHETCMGWGMSCGDGWYDLIDRVCARITELDPEGNCYASQIKEKIGGLRFYVDGATKEIYDAIEDLADESYSICELCGQPGRERTANFWVTVRCDECHEFGNKLIE